MILLLGGTSETAPIANALALTDFEVLVSTATTVPLDLPSNPKISRRSGGMDQPAMVALCQQRGIRAIVDATHPFAEIAHSTARKAAEELKIPLLRYIRAQASLPEEPNVQWAKDHSKAAQLAFAANGPVLLTTGSRHLAPYVEQARKTGLPLVARVLSNEESLAACRNAGLAESQIITGRGPFGVEENRETIRRFSIAALVTKESGDAGGFTQKIEAARLENCRTVVIRRPQEEAAVQCATVEAVVSAMGHFLA